VSLDWLVFAIVVPYAILGGVAFWALWGDDE
jgi:hypothetical protein